MFTFTLLYISFYYQIIYMLFLYLNIYVNIVNIQQFSFSQLLIFIKTYTSNYNYVYILFLLLSGLPPVIFFLIKLVFLITIFNTISISIQFILFINFLLSMLFYLQCFNITKNNTKNNLLLLSTKNKFFSVLHNNKLEISSYKYLYWVFYVLIVSTQICGFIFFFDLFLIVDNLCTVIY